MNTEQNQKTTEIKCETCKHKEHTQNEMPCCKCKDFSEWDKLNIKGS